MDPVTQNILLEYLSIFGWPILAAFIIAGLCGQVGSFLVMRRMSFLVDTLGHAAVLGMALALVLDFFPQLVLLPYTVGLGLLMTWLARRHRQELTAVTAVIFSVSVSLGVILLSQHSGGGHEAMHVFFGNLLWIGQGDVLFIVLVALPVSTFLLLKKQELVLMIIDESLARTRRIRVDRLDYLFVVCISAVLVSAIKLVGIILIMGLIAIPPLCSARFAKGLKSHLLLSPLAAILSVGIGIPLSFQFDWPTGPCIVLTAGILYALSILFSRKRAV